MSFRSYGTAVNLPRNPKSPSFVQNDGIPNGVNQLHVTPLYDILSRTFADVIIQPEPKKDEIGALVEMLKRNTFAQKTLIIADRGFESYNLIGHCLEKPNTDFLIRVKQSRSAMREVAKLPLCELDCNISFTITTTQTNEDKKGGYIHLQVPKKSKAGSKTRCGRWDFLSPYPMKLRVCRFLLDNGEFETVATSLPRSFSLDDIKELYHLRWGIETAFRDWKYTLGLVNLHGKSDAFAEQKIYASLTVFNFASRVCPRGCCPSAEKRRLRLQGEFQNGGHALQGAFANAEHGRRNAVKRNRAAYRSHSSEQAGRAQFACQGILRVCLPRSRVKKRGWCLRTPPPQRIYF